MKMTTREFEQRYADLPDLIRLSVGQPGYPVPRAVREAIQKQLDEPLQPYPPQHGDPALLDALAHKHGVGCDQLVITHGASEAMTAAMTTLFQPQDTICLAFPGYPAYFSLCELLNLNAVFLPCVPWRFQPNFGALSEALCPKIRALVLITCGNPTSQPLTLASLRQAEALCLRYDWTLILDASYEAFEKTPLPNPCCRFLKFHSFSKSYGMTGLRIGYGYGDRALIQKIRQWVALNTVGVADCIQKGALAALALSTEETVQKVRRQSQAMIDLLRRFDIPCGEEPGFYCYFDVAAMALSAQEWVDRCAKEAGVLMMPGDAFGPDQKTRVRACCAAQNMPEALKRLEAFLSRALSMR